jgi:hypothetical protein
MLDTLVFGLLPLLAGLVLVGALGFDAESTAFLPFFRLLKNSVSS